MKKLSVQPQSPKHFVQLCFGLLKLDQSLKGENFLMEKYLHVGVVALFKCAYGYFWVNGLTREVISKEFHESPQAAIKCYKALRK
jgi:hypothetical protein